MLVLVVLGLGLGVTGGGSSPGHLPLVSRPLLFPSSLTTRVVISLIGPLRGQKGKTRKTENPGFSRAHWLDGLETGPTLGCSILF